MAKVNWINGGIEPMDAERCYVIAEWAERLKENTKEE